MSKLLGQKENFKNLEVGRRVGETQKIKESNWITSHNGFLKSNQMQKTDQWIKFWKTTHILDCKVEVQWYKLKIITKPWHNPRRTAEFSESGSQD